MFVYTVIVVNAEEPTEFETAVSNTFSDLLYRANEEDQEVDNSYELVLNTNIPGSYYLRHYISDTGAEIIISIQEFKI